MTNKRIEINKAYVAAPEDRKQAKKLAKQIAQPRACDYTTPGDTTIGPSEKDIVAVLKERKLRRTNTAPPNYSFGTGKPRKPTTYEDWKYYIGNENSHDEKLTSQMLRKWAANPNRQLECIYDGETWPANYWYCPECKEYKGLIPYIPEWSDWR